MVETGWDEENMVTYKGYRFSREEVWLEQRALGCTQVQALESLYQLEKSLEARFSHSGRGL